MVYKTSIISTFLLLIYLPSAVAVFQSEAQIEENAKFERRTFHKRPKLAFTLDSINGFPEQFERYFRDHFGLRRAFVQLHDQLLYRGFGMSPRRLYLPGRDGWFFRGYGNMRVQKDVDTSFDAVSDFMGQIPFTAKELKEWKRVLENRKKKVEAHGGKYIFAIAPTKADIYPEYLPESIRTRKGKTRAEQLNAYLKRYTNVHVVDLFKALRQAKTVQPAPYLYYKTDFHWNYYGAYWAYHALIKQAARLFPDLGVQSTTLEDFDIRYKKDWVDDAFRSTFGVTIKDEYPILALKKISPRYNPISKSRRSFFTNPKKKEVQVLTNPGKTEFGSILIAGDSFIEKTAGYFSANSKETYFTREIMNFPNQVYNSEVTPELVIQSLMGDYLVMKDLSGKKKKPRKKR